MSTNLRVSLHGKMVGLSPENNLVSEGIEISRPAVDAIITVGLEVANVRAINIQLNDSTGSAIVDVETVEIIMFLNAARTAFAAVGGSTGIAIGTDGALLALVAKKVFLATSETTGSIDLSWTDTGTEVAYLGVRLPNGRIVMSAALTNA